MAQNQKLYEYLSQHAEEISSTWYETIEETDPNSIYSSTDPAVIKNLKSQNLAFNYKISRIFIDEEEVYLPILKAWAFEVTQDQEHLKTPIHYIIREFVRVRDLYISYVKDFVHINQDTVKSEEAEDLYHTLIKAFDLVIHIFIEEMYKNTSLQLQAQKDMITELSAPVIVLFHSVGLLPLIGDIDTVRAKLIMENALNQCAKKKVTQLYIDLSGVAVIDTMVAHQLFSLIEALRLIGVSSTLSGIRPEIAQTAVQLGLSFEDISLRSTLASAIASDLKLKKV
ncbi:RsbT co-antagonist protein RsbRB [Bacillus halotolerans]|uniref:STAS domain-containing protein n=1 Tax=Bacillus halotolerans TaxID=260554 RepID=UPI000D01C57D|nr:STAS domain-containing protein [Bacillus halotolerans]MBL6009883.1 STAS domain-containing protein [Bacillus halotolerans]PRP50214.1 RsbT co-antagonist protein RsbRB [Bacillus halotolerans]PRP52339.1 RsbT co-antagonist protein RsbRB [Bacillus halotolerans]PRP58636.1 RsbT co-antagonist protein RsbRB [Bacillus halotolerans]PRP63575.1 RsbT co-antagonist protein RsbRB [Bacillus halotolerans]